MSPETFEGVRRSLAAYLQGRDVYVLDAAAGADPDYRMPLQVITELAWHNLFARQLFLRADKSDLNFEASRIYDPLRTKFSHRPTYR